MEQWRTRRKNIDAWKREIEGAKRNALAEAKVRVFTNFLKNLQFYKY